MSSLIERFTTLQLPDAIDSIVLGTDEMEPGSTDAALSRYASRLLGELGASRMRDIVAKHDIDARRLSTTDLFWLRFDPDEVATDERSYLLAAEGIMNRLRLVEEEISAKGQQHRLFQRSKVNEGDCALADLHIVEAVADVAPSLSRGVINPLAQLGSAACARGGEWDVRTSFAVAMESVRLPYRLAYEFDCSTQEGLFRVDYTVPEPSWMPRTRYYSKGSKWVDEADKQARLCDAYAVRLASVLAAAAFGAGVGIRRVRLVGRRMSLDGAECLSLVVDRIPFLTVTLPSIARNKPGWVAEFRNACEGDDAALDAVLAAGHVPLVQDDRRLAADLADKLHADAAWELDVLSPMPNEAWDAVHEARADQQNAPMAAIATLEEVVASAGLPQPDAKGRLPLYCSDIAARILLPSTAPDVRYWRYPDSAYAARSLLCDLYLRLGEPERALQQAKEMIALGPSSTTGYSDAVNACFEMERYADAIPLLRTALPLATQELTASWLLYRLAFALWRTGSPSEGLACYVLAAHHGFPRQQVLFGEMSDLLSQLAFDEAPTVSEAVEQVQAAGFTLPWNAMQMSRLREAAVALADARIFGMAGPLCLVTGLAPAYRDEVYVVGHSMRHGICALDPLDESDETEASGGQAG